MGQGEIEGSRYSTTQSGINTTNISINDAEQQKNLTGESVEEALTDVKTATTTDTAEENSGELRNIFNQAEIEQIVNDQQSTTQELNKSVKQVSGVIKSNIDDLNKKFNNGNGEITEAEYNEQLSTLNNYNLLVSTIGAGLLAPTDSLVGQLAAAASPTVSYSLGQYFKGLAASNENGQLSGAEETAHVFAHGILAAAVASAGGNDEFTAGVTATASEAAAPLLTQWLYGSSNPDDLSADQKETITSILGLTSTAVGASTGDASNAVAAGQLSENAVANNFLSEKDTTSLIDFRENQTVQNAGDLRGLDYDNQRSDQLLEKYKEDPASLSNE